MSFTDSIMGAADRFQRRHRLPGFLYAIIKKYGDDQAGYQAALLTYYGFLSLFPLLLVLATAATMVAHNNPHLQHSLIHGITNYFPVLGNQLSAHIQTLHKSGIALIIGLLFTLYGARGVANAFIYGTNQVWHVPRTKRAGFPKAIVQSLSVIIVGGLGLLIASATASIAATVEHGVIAYVISAVLDLAILFGVFVALMKLSLTGRVTLSELKAGAFTAAVALLILQEAGTFLLTRELKNLSALYSNFAIPLGLLFWIYLQSQVLYYCIEIAHVQSHRLWPRSLTGKNLTEADKASYGGQARKEKAVPPENIRTSFNQPA